MGKRNKNQSDKEQQNNDIIRKKKKERKIIQIDIHSQHITSENTNVKTESKKVIHEEPQGESRIRKSKDKSDKIKPSKNKSVLNSFIVSNIDSILETNVNKSKKIKKKKIFNEEVIDNNLNNETNIESIIITKIKLDQNVVPNEEFNNKDSHQSTNNKKVKKRRKENALEQKSQVQDTGSILEVNTDNCKMDKKKKKVKSITEEATKSKDELPQETIGVNSKKSKKKPKRKNEEEVINDEDIDRFCEELDEVHNKQYENWIQLIEANLKANKN